MDPAGLAYIVVGLIVGGTIGWLLAKQTMNSQIIRSEERIRASEEAIESNEQKVRAEIKNLVTDLGRQNSEDFLKLAEERLGKVTASAEKDLETRKIEVENLIKPLKDEMAKLSKSNQEIEKEREGAYQAIKRQLHDLGEKAETLSTRTTALATTLTTSPNERGEWGEMKLRRIFEMAGMSEHVDFFEQESIEAGRPDYIVRLPQRGVIPIDSKAIGHHYLKAVEAESPEDQNRLLHDHSDAMKKTITRLSSKAYQDSIEGDFDHVIMFIPSEAMAAAAFTTDPELMDHAMKKKVLIATPVTMLGLLRTVALYWKQYEFSQSASTIYEVTEEMYNRVETMISHMMTIGTHLDNATKKYNETMRSYESRVLPQARKLDQLKVSETIEKLPDPKEIQSKPERIP
jgi:DNA recombination protein RmuC